MSDHTLSPQKVLKTQVDDPSLLDAYKQGASGEVRDWKCPTNGARKRWPKRTDDSWREVMVTVGLTVTGGDLYKVWWEITGGGQWKRSSEALWGQSHHKVLNQVHDESSRRQAWIQYLEWVADEGSDPLSVLDVSGHALVPWRLCASREAGAVTIYAARRLEDVGGRSLRYMAPGYLPKGLLELCRCPVATDRATVPAPTSDQKHAIAPTRVSSIEDLAELIKGFERASLATTSLAKERKHIESQETEGMPDGLFFDMKVQESLPPAELRDRVRKAAEERLGTSAPAPM